MPVVLLAVALGAWWVVRSVRRRGAAGSPPELGAVGWTAGARWSTLGPLARVENRVLLRHPVFLIGIAVTPLMLWAATLADDAGSDAAWRRLAPGIALALVPLGWLTIVAVNLTVLRPARHGTSELFATLPAPQPVRTAAALATTITASVVAAVLATGWVVLLAVRTDLVGAPQWREIAAGVLVVAGAVTVGVAVGRWLPFVAFGVAAAVAVTVIQTRFLDDTTWPWNAEHSDPVRFLGFLAEPTAVGDAALEIRPAWWHLVYLLALIAVMCVVALARDGLPRPLSTALVVALAVAGAAGWAQTRPPSDAEVARMVSYITNPAEHQVCEQRGTARYCAYPPFRGSIDRWDDSVRSVLALVPPTVGDRPIEVVQRVPVTIGNSDCAPQPFATGLPADVAGRLSPPAVWPDDGHLHPDLGNGSFPCDDRATNGLFTAVQAGAWAVGLPAAPHHDDVRCTADGQARAVIALWLGAAATANGAELLADLASAGATPGGALLFHGWDNPPMWGVVYTAADARLAGTMLGRPPREIAAALHADWQRWTDPSTSSAELANHLGLPASDGPGRFSTCP